MSGVTDSVPTPILGGDAAHIVIPGGDMLLHADFTRAGADLLITAPDGSQFVIVDYFDGQTEAGLITEGGALLPFDLVSALAGPASPGQYAQSEDGIEEVPIGRVDETVGEVTATRVDGTTVNLTKDSPVFQGDILETGAGGAVAVVFIDETEFSLGEDGRMVLDELIFDRTSLEGSSTFSVIQGVFVFVSGEIAANNPDEMIVRTPVATLGIRGTKVAGKAAAEGALNTVTMMPESGGTVTGSITVSTQTSSITLNTAWQTTAVSSVFEAPAPAIILTSAQAGTLYGAVNSLLLSSTSPAARAGDAAGGRDEAAPGGRDEAAAAPADEPEGPASGPEGELGPGEELGPEGELGPGEEFAPGEGFGPEGELGPGEEFAPGEGFGPEGELGPGEEFAPGEGFGPEGELGPGEGFGPEGELGPGEEFAPGEGFGPEGAFGPGEEFTPGEGFGPEGAFGPGEEFTPGEGFGPEGAFGPGEEFTPGEGFGPEGAFGPGEEFTNTLIFGPDEFVPGEFFATGDFGDEFSQGTLMAAGLAAAEDAFSALEATFEAGGSFNDAFYAADAAGHMAFDAYMGTAGTEMFDALVEFGPQAVFSDPSTLATFEAIEGQFEHIAEAFGEALGQDMYSRIDPTQYGAFARGEFEGEFQRGEFGGGEFQRGEFGEGEFQRGEFGEGEFQRGEFGEGEFQRGEFGEGEFQRGEFGEGEFQRGEFGEGEFQRGEFGEGEFQRGEFGEGEFQRGEFGEGEFQRGEFGEGEFQRGEFGEGEFQRGEFGEGEFQRGEFGGGEFQRGEFGEGETFGGGDQFFGGGDQFFGGGRPVLLEGATSSLEGATSSLEGETSSLEKERSSLEGATSSLEGVRSSSATSAVNSLVTSSFSINSFPTK